MEATPTAELLPLSAGVQDDETEMGLTYAELSVFGVCNSSGAAPSEKAGHPADARLRS